MTDFWPTCGFSLLERGAGGRLIVTDDYLRLYYRRPELAPVPESCAAERALHAALLADPRRTTTAAEVAAIADADARENYGVMLRFRKKLLDAPDLATFYFNLFGADVTVPPDFVHHTAQVLLRGMLDGAPDALEARAAELFFRPQRVTIQDGAVMLADAATVETHATDSGLGNIGRMLVQVQAPVRAAELDVLDDANRDAYWRRDERHDTVLHVNPGQPGSLALCRVIEKWIAHFHGLRARVSPIREIPDEDWLWHVGLDAEATALLNAVYDGSDVGEGEMMRIIGLFRTDFDDPAALRPELAGAPVFLGLAMTPDRVLRMKPQNLLTNLPLARRA